MNAKRVMHKEEAPARSGVTVPDEGPIQPSTQYMGGRTIQRYFVAWPTATETSRQDKLETLTTIAKHPNG
jgi:hypothetical protein